MVAKVTVTVYLGVENTAEQIKAGIDLLEKLSLGAPITDASTARTTEGNDENKQPATDTGDVSVAAPKAPVVPIAPKPPAASSSASPAVDLDSEGLPWDGRIHGSAKKKLAKGGTWKLIRNVDPKLVETVKAELKATMEAATTSEAESAPTLAPGEAAAAFGGGDDVEAVEDTPMSFPTLMNLITAKTGTDELSQADIDAAITEQGLTSLPMLASRPDLVPAVAQKLALA